MTRLLKVAGDLVRQFAGPIVLGLMVGGVTLGLWALWEARRGETAAREAARAKGGQVVSQAGETATGAALEATAEYGERELGRAALEQETRDAVLSAPNSADDAGAAGDAGLVGLCRRPSYRDHPRCAGLRRADPAPAAR